MRNVTEMNAEQYGATLPQRRDWTGVAVRNDRSLPFLEQPYRVWLKESDLPGWWEVRGIDRVGMIGVFFSSKNSAFAFKMRFG